METLGPHELAHVFANLNDPADIACARAVCHEWRDIMSPPHINGRLMVDILRLASNEILHVTCHGATDFNQGLWGACHGGHKEIVELMCDYGATNFDKGLGGACEGGRKEMAELMISRGATNFNCGLYSACWSGHKEMAELMIKYGAARFSDGLYAACITNHADLAVLMISFGAPITVDCLYVSCLRHHKSLAKLLGHLAPNIRCVKCNKLGLEH